MPTTRSTDPTPKKRTRSSGRPNYKEDGEKETKKDKNYEMVNESDEEEDEDTAVEEESEDEEREDEEPAKSRRVSTRKSKGGASTTEASSSAQPKSSSTKPSTTSSIPPTKPKSEPEAQQFIKRIEHATTKLYQLAFSKKYEKLQGLLDLIEQEQPPSKEQPPVKLWEDLEKILSQHKPAGKK